MKIFKRIISALTSCVLASSFVTSGVISGHAEGSEVSGGNGIGNTINQFDIKGNNDVGNLIAKAVGAEYEQTEEAENTNFRISEVTVENGIVKAEYSVVSDCTLVVGFYSDDESIMYSSIKEDITFESGNSREITMGLPAEVPEYFYIKAFLIADNYAPLSKVYETSYYTEAISTIRNSSINDYDQDLVVPLEEDNDNSFLVLQEDTKKIIYDGEHNIIDDTEIAEGTYHFTNADSQLTSLKKDDVVYYNYSDNEIYMFKVRDIEINETDVTITESEMTLSDACSVYKIQERVNGTVDLEEGKEYENGLTYIGSETESEPDPEEDITLTPNRKSGLKSSFWDDVTNPVELPIYHTFTWKNNDLSIAKTEPEEDFDNEKKNQIEFPTKYSEAGEGKIYGKIGGFVEIKIIISGKLIIDIFGNDNGQEYSSVKAKTKMDISGSVGIEGEAKLIVVGMNFSEKSFTALVGCGFELSGKVKFDFSIMSIEGTQGVVLNRKLIGIKSVDLINQVDNVKVEPKGELSGDCFFGLFAEAKVSHDSGPELDFYGNTGLKVKSKLFSSENIEDVKNGKSPTLHTCLNCVEGTINVTADIKAKAGLGKLFGGKMNISTSVSDLLDGFLDGNDSKLADFYYSYTYMEGGIGKTCPHKLTQLVIYADSDGKNLKNVNITVDIKNQYIDFLATDFQGKTDENGCFKMYLPNNVDYEVTAEYNGVTLYETGNHNYSRSIEEFHFDGVSVLPDDIPDNPKDPDEPQIPTDAEVIDEGKCGENVNYKLYDEGTLVISGTGEIDVFSDMEHSWWTAYNPDKNIKKVIIEEGVTSIGKSTFDRCTSLTSITIPDSVTSIGEYAFDGCKSLTSITIPDSVTSIGDGAFQNCESLTSVKIPDSVESISAGAFEYCTSLTSVTIPESVTRIEEYAFKGCSSLTSVTIPDSVTSIGEGAFFGCTSLTSVIIGNGVTQIGKEAFYKTLWLENMQKKNPLVIVNGILIKGKTCVGDVIIPNSVTSIGEEAFIGCTGITSVKIPDSVESISAGAFEECTSLTSVTIPDSVTLIEYSAFNDCINLTDVYYSGTEAEWNNISIDGNNEYLTNATIHYNSTGNDLICPASVNYSAMKLG